MKRGILIATAGTSSMEASEVFCRLDGKVAARFPGVARYWAYTSRGVRNKLLARGQAVDDPARAVSRMHEDGITHAVVFSLHMAPGMEYTELCEAVTVAAKAPRRFEMITMRRPLLSCTRDVNRMIEALIEDIPADPAAGDGVLLVAHGSRRTSAQEVYADADAICRRLDRQVFLGTMMPRSNMDEMVPVLRRAGLRRVFLVPFMIAAGESARNEVAGSGPSTWQTAVEAAGMECCPVLKGLGEYDGVVDVWLDQMQSQLWLCDLEHVDA